MSYLVLARKSRPQTFSQVVGQRPIVRTLQNALTQNRVPHALIFSGVRGTGKTTLARIMAKALNCEQGPAAEPCNVCCSCRDITEGTSIDLQEVDGASNRGIQEIRELKDKIRFMPTSSRYKIIIIDEVHMLTTEAFNALLKTLEEPPHHVYFMFATTELHKVPVTILSRCQRYELKRINRQELIHHFKALADSEGVQIETEALEMVVREAGGSVRDGLSLLDQLFSYCGKEVCSTEVVEVLGLVSQRLIADLGIAVLNGDLATIYTLLDQVYRQGTDSKRVANNLLHWFRSLLLCKVSRKPDQFLDVADDELTALAATASNHSLESVAALFDLLFEGLEKANLSRQPRLALELAFIRAVQFRDMVPVTDLIDRFDRILTQYPLDSLPAAPTNPSPPPPRPPLESKKPLQPPGGATHYSPPAAHASIPAEVLPEVQSQQAAAPPFAAAVPKPQHTTDQTPNQEQPPERIPALEAAPAMLPATNGLPVQPPPPSGQGKKRIRRDWDAFLGYVRERQPWMAAALHMAASVDRQEDLLLIHFADSGDCTMLKQRDNVKVLSEYVLDYFQENLRIQFLVPGSAACAIDPANGLAPLQERRALANDPLVLTALDIFTGQVGEIRIGSSYRNGKKASIAKPSEYDQTDEE